ncbi:MAG: hypothetical protein ABW019_17435 [Chitinophagaceae bacterium]
MTIAFTLCSNNYLAEAKTLGDSILAHNPGWKFVIGLVDRKSAAIDYSPYAAFDIIEAETIGIENFRSMVQRYNIVELNTSVKADYFDYLFRTHAGGPLSVFYFDPDIVVYHPLDILETALQHHDMVLTPHILSPMPDDGLHPNEQLLLQCGIYNLGFAGLRKSDASLQLIDWWKYRLHHYCYSRPGAGLFVDQLWMNFAPYLFGSCFILKHPGANAAYWNLHERTFSSQDDKWLVNGEPLLFYHFSALSYSKPGNIAKYCTRYTLENRPKLAPLIEDYKARLKANNYTELRKVPCMFVGERNAYLQEQKQELYKQKPYKRFKHLISKLIPKKIKAALLDDGTNNYQ